MQVRLATGGALTWAKLRPVPTATSSTSPYACVSSSRRSSGKPSRCASWPSSRRSYEAALQGGSDCGAAHPVAAQCQGRAAQARLQRSHRPARPAALALLAARRPLRAALAAGRPARPPRWPAGAWRRHAGRTLPALGSEEPRAVPWPCMPLMTCRLRGPPCLRGTACRSGGAAPACAPTGLGLLLCVLLGS